MNLRLHLGLILLVLFAARGEAQGTSDPWHPLPGIGSSLTEELRYDYQRTDHVVPAFPLWSDSAGTVDGDSVWWLHPYPAICDTCNCYRQGRYYPGLPSIFGHALRKTGPAEWALAYPEKTLRLRPGAALADPWTFQDGTPKTAWIDARFDTLLWGTSLDSVQRILVSTGDTILLSKAHGILHFPIVFADGDRPAYRLSGIAGPDLGTYMPDWKDCFRYAPGTLLQYEYRYALHEMSVPSLEQLKDILLQIEVLDVREFDDSIAIDVKGLQHGFKYKDGLTPTYDSALCSFSATWTATPDRFELRAASSDVCGIGYGLSTALPFDRYPYAWAPKIKPSGYSYPEHLELLTTVQFNTGRLMLTNNPTLPLARTVSWQDFRTPEPFSTIGPLDEASYLCNDGPPPGQPEGSTMSIMEGLGLVRWGQGSIRYGERLTLTAYQTATDSFGTFTHPLLLVAEQWPNTFTWSLKSYPNPSNGMVYVTGMDYATHMRVIDVHGRTVLSGPFQDGEAVDLSSLANGLYWIELQKGNQRGLARVSILKP